MPEPLSATRISRQSLAVSILILAAPASIEFSTSSFTTDAGRSITSPAAIWFIKCLDNCLILAIFTPESSYIYI